MLKNALNDRRLDYKDKSKHSINKLSLGDKDSTSVVLDSSYKPFNIRELDAGKIMYD